MKTKTKIKAADARSQAGWPDGTPTGANW